MGGSAVVVEQFLISGGSKEFSVPLTFFDMLWYNFLPDQSLLLFKFPCSKSHFLETMVPHFKKSLSLTLPHFLPLAGNIIHSESTTTEKPIVLYTSDDSVSCTFAIYEDDDNGESVQFLNPNNDKLRLSSELYCFAPCLPPSKCYSDGSIGCPVLALQVTLIPGQGICVGFVTHHAVSDACTVVSFMRAWALIHRNITINHLPCINTKALLVENNCFPSYERETVVDVNNLDSIYLDFIRENRSSLLRHEKLKEISDPSFEKVRSTFILTKDQIQNLKKYYMILVGGDDKNYKPANHLTSFVVACALVWFCSAKAVEGGAGGELVADDEPEYLGYMVDCRGRFMSPPLPANYFGNCVGPVIVELKHGELKGDNGFAIAVESMMETIKERVHGGGKGMLELAHEWPEYQKLGSKRQCWVAGSPKFDFYGVDFGWGMPRKFEALFIDIGDGAILLGKSRDFEGGLEIGLSKPKAHMEAFTAVFNKVLADSFHCSF